MKHLKKYGDYSIEDIIKKIKDTVDSLVYDFESYDDFEPNNFREISTDLALLSYKNKIDDVYYNIEDTIFMPLKEFIILYNKLVKESEKKVINYLKEYPFPNIENITNLLDIPQHIIDNNIIMNKFNI